MSYMRVDGLNMNHITIHRRLKFNVKKSNDFLSSHMKLNLSRSCLIIWFRFNPLTRMRYFSLI